MHFLFKERSIIFYYSMLDCLVLVNSDKYDLLFIGEVYVAHGSHCSPMWIRVNKHHKNDILIASERACRIQCHCQFLKSAWRSSNSVVFFFHNKIPGQYKREQLGRMQKYLINKYLKSVSFTW